VSVHYHKNCSAIFAPVRVREILGVWDFNWLLEATVAFVPHVILLSAGFFEYQSIKRKAPNFNRVGNCGQ
jgi:hypothetical protein